MCSEERAGRAVPFWRAGNVCDPTRTGWEGVPRLPPINTRGTDLPSPLGSSSKPIKGEAPAWAHPIAQIPEQWVISGTICTAKSVRHFGVPGSAFQRSF